MRSEKRRDSHLQLQVWFVEVDHLVSGEHLLRLLDQGRHVDANGGVLVQLADEGHGLVEPLGFLLCKGDLEVGPTYSITIYGGCYFANFVFFNGILP